tara:strand:- start:367 stop:786 length:420 start_codon:yes stop_codon:yes gene_type:complete
MDLANISTPKFVQGFSLKDVLTKGSKPKRKSAFSELRVDFDSKQAQGYSIKTDRFRLIRWTYDFEIHYELYDHKYDKEENTNLVKNTSYKNTLDFLKLTLNNRIEEARKKPNGLGRQFENAKPTLEPVRIHSAKKSSSY